MQPPPLSDERRFTRSTTRAARCWPQSLCCWDRGDLLWTTTLAVLLIMWIPTFYKSMRGGFDDSWAYTDLLINWSDGFVRRGLYGTFAILFHSITGNGVSLLTAIIFAILTLLQIGILFYLLRQFKDNYVVMILIGLSPAMMLFAVYAPGAYWRKESFLYLAILLHALICRQYLTRNISFSLYMKLLGFLIIPLLVINTLIYEVQALFVPFHLALTLSVYDLGGPRRDLRTTKSILFLYCIVLIPLAASIIAHGDPQKSASMFDNVRSWSGVSSKKAIGIHGWTLAESSRTARAIIRDPFSVVTYLVGFLLGPVLLVTLLQSQYPRAYHNRLITWPFVPPLALFLIGWDWGRWINMIAVHGVAYVLHLPCQPVSGTSILRSVERRYQTILVFVLISLLTLYTISWSLPHCCLHPNLFTGNTFISVWIQIYGAIRATWAAIY
jgi:hypothetical protein